MIDCRTASPIALALTLALAAPAAAPADGGVTYQDIAGAASGLVYSREPSARFAVTQAQRADGFIAVLDEYLAAPWKPYGAPGVALVDFDGDGDLDIYVTNGPGADNSLFSNQLKESGQLAFVDVAAASGVAATGQDSQGVCFGDIDNDGDPDLYVLGSGEPNRLFENQGNGTFADITAASGTGGGDLTSVSCSMGDVDGDGLLDIYVANTFDFDQQLAYTVEPFAFNEHDLLFVNAGGNTFIDAGAAAGIEDVPGLPVPGAALPTWPAAAVDIDQDGDVDLMISGDQRVLLGGDPVGFNRVYRNDGTGAFTEAAADFGLDTRVGSWHGLAFGDLDCDRRLDFFVTNLGDYIFFPGSFPPGDWASRWFLQQADGTFADPGPGALVTVPTGWGTSMLDYDNDGDLDVTLHGGQDSPLFLDATNPGVILQNQGCSGSFTWDQAALAASTDHTLRNVEGLAVGDLNGDGFPDVVTVSSFDLPPSAPLLPFFANPLGSVFDAVGWGVFSTVPTADPLLFQVVWDDQRHGGLAVEINSGGNGNRWAGVRLEGSVGITSAGAANRDGIGAVVTFTPRNGLPVSRPVMGGSSYASQDSLELTFGLGSAAWGTAEVLWPGGVRNRLYRVYHDERLLFPEIPCSFADEWTHEAQYVTCVAHALHELGQAGVLQPGEQLRFFASAIRAYLEEHGLPF